jgi:hypothetical protein
VLAEQGGAVAPAVTDGEALDVEPPTSSSSSSSSGKVGLDTVAPGAGDLGSIANVVAQEQSDVGRALAAQLMASAKNRTGLQAALVPEEEKQAVRAVLADVLKLAKHYGNAAITPNQTNRVKGAKAFSQPPTAKNKAAEFWGMKIVPRATPPMFTLKDVLTVTGYGQDFTMSPMFANPANFGSCQRTAMQFIHKYHTVAMNWGHDEELKTHHQKIIVHLETTMPYPSHIGAGEAASGDSMEEAKRRAKVVKLEGPLSKKDEFFKTFF